MKNWKILFSLKRTFQMNQSWYENYKTFHSKDITSQIMDKILTIKLLTCVRIYGCDIDKSKLRHLHKPITFASVKVYCLITLICLIILISHIAQLLLIRKTIVFVQVRIFSLNMHDIIVYVAWWWEKYLSKRSLIKHSCLWRDKLII